MGIFHDFRTLLKYFLLPCLPFDSFVTTIFSIIIHKGRRLEFGWNVVHKLGHRRQSTTKASEICHLAVLTCRGNSTVDSWALAPWFAHDMSHGHGCNLQRLQGKVQVDRVNRVVLY